MTGPGLPLTTGEGNSASLGLPACPFCGGELCPVVLEGGAQGVSCGGCGAYTSRLPWREPWLYAGRHDDPDYSPAYQDEYQRLWHEARAECGRLREQLDAARQALDLVDAPYPLDVFPERTPEQRDAIFAAMRAVDKHATEWFYAHVARERGRVARAVLGVEGPAG